MYPNNLKACSTIQDLIEYGEAIPISNQKLHFKKVFTSNDEKITINYLSVLDKYYSLLLEKAIAIKLSDSDFSKYKYKPKLLCYDVYNNMDMAPLILRINNMLSVTEFTKQEILMFKTDIVTFINEILILEEDNINNNASEIEKEMRR